MPKAAGTKKARTPGKPSKGKDGISLDESGYVWSTLESARKALQRYIADGADPDGMSCDDCSVFEVSVPVPYSISLEFKGPRADELVRAFVISEDEADAAKTMLSVLNHVTVVDRGATDEAEAAAEIANQLIGKLKDLPAQSRRSICSKIEDAMDGIDEEDA